MTHHSSTKAMKTIVSIAEWGENPMYKPLVIPLVRLLVEEKSSSGKGGVADLVEEFRHEGYAGHVDSWVRRGPKGKSLKPVDVARVLGDKVVDELAVDAGIPLNGARERLARILPQFIGVLSPEGEWDPAAAQAELVDYMRAVSLE
jgi:uncharacterized protein YidB (DUF937 family)